MRLTRLFTVAGVLLLVATVPAAPSHAEPGEAFAGYDATALGSGFTAAPYLPTLLPVEAPFEATMSLAVATLSTGGRGFGRASFFWPGTLTAFLRPLLETGAGIALPIPDYPLVVESREFESAKHNDAPGISMATDVTSSAAKATAQDGALTFPGIIDIGSIRTVSTSILEDARITATSVTQINGFDLLAGAVHIDSIATTASAITDGVTSTCEGAVTITGASVSGTPVSIDEKGVHAQGDTLVPGIDLNTVVDEVLKASGITLRVLGGIGNCAGATGTQTTGGLLFSVKLPTAGPVPPGGHFDAVLGSVAAAVSVTDPYSAGTPTPTTGPAPLPTFPTFGDGGSFVPPSVAPPTTGTPPAVTPSPDTEPASYSFAGVSATLVVALLLLSIPAATRMRRYFERLMTMPLGTG